MARIGGTAMPETDANGKSQVKNLEQGLYADRQGLVLRQRYHYPV